MSDQMHEVIRRQLAHADSSHRADRRGWTTRQWAEDARYLMLDVDGAITSLVNGHVLALLRENAELRAAIAEHREAAEEGPCVHDCQQCMTADYALWAVLDRQETP